jgi:5-methylcytosine-specific restriction endonuclease McrA
MTMDSVIKCEACGKRELLEWNHVRPLAGGGTESPYNLQILCRRCNRIKGPWFIRNWEIKRFLKWKLRQIMLACLKKRQEEVRK